MCLWGVLLVLVSWIFKPKHLTNEFDRPTLLVVKHEDIVEFLKNTQLYYISNDQLRQWRK